MSVTTAGVLIVLGFFALIGVVMLTSNHEAELYHCLQTTTDKSICDTLRK